MTVKEAVEKFRAEGKSSKEVDAFIKGMEAMHKIDYRDIKKILDNHEKGRKFEIF